MDLLKLWYCGLLIVSGAVLYGVTDCSSWYPLGSFNIGVGLTGIYLLLIDRKKGN